MNNRITICFSADNDHVAKTYRCIKSILEYKTLNDELFIYLLWEDMLPKQINKIFKLKKRYNFGLKLINIDHDLFTTFKIPEICISEDKIIYISSKIKIQSSLEKLFNADIEEFYLGIISGNPEDEIINSDILIFNAKKWRNDKMSLKYILQNKKFKKQVRYLKKWQIANPRSIGKTLFYKGKTES